MPLSKQPQQKAIENQSDRPTPSLQFMGPIAPDADVRSVEPDATAAETTVDLDEMEFSPERPGPAWMWTFGIGG
ncbi:MAG: hypothetical protein AAGF98_14080 [Cyanobacteria bacterium P01_H01_bin.153]